MRSSWNPQPSELDDYAEHIEYEVRMLLQQFGWLELRLADVEAKKRVDIGADGQALLEAVLVHLRLLDDFVGSPRQWQAPSRRDGDDVFARHWDPRWRPNRFLSPKQRERTNAHLAHLTARRLTARWDIQPEELPDIVTRCCRRLEELFAQVPAGHLAAFRPAGDRDAPGRVDAFLHDRSARKWAT
jgi:hypothetical protein